jgi:hypothetical protein
MKAYLETFELIAKEDKVDTKRVIKEREEDIRIIEERITFTKNPLVKDENIVVNNIGVNITSNKTNTIHIS